jgi:N-acetylglucosamine kinase-like BadF-type ATPase
MSADDTKAAPSLADQFENFLKYGKDDEFIRWIDKEGVTILAALRAVEVVRTWRKRVLAEADQKGSGQWVARAILAEIDAALDGIGAALLEGEK